ncbi:LysR family transcriptional regulator [Tetragenococcus koreensis]|uniref:LysR family transcriptional regulator n=1 Tax=Tetragenococcus koreensis TaxID=290335 RepID=A0AAN4RJD7_9ENTE|nr:LysR family transcriptional regulator [Tetragenococcus koreensis]GEQ48610.1 LysR family transcriptional regulator [Tetragenococcus koreensis]GEQ51039.1 LysR family transcriptional regulator [Tetragenococcus koreensis]GEQ53618.1 LysR family transcriptional regulator [Tetragenococcus koreensis]GEQ56047.1 LysR family transcriptional regulator [Tetragenococcus koreensis]GEQ58623.1 LysR family transcriptional regulator [Tetragenococcus koreensis]
MFHLLKSFLSVYETHNFTKTANSLYLTQPTVSAQIRKLEDYLNVTLFIRNGKQEILPTKEADFLYPRVLKILEEWNDAITHVNTQKSYRENCVLASSQTCGAYLIPKIVPILVKHFPMVNFSFPVMSGEEIVQELEKAKVDFGLIETPERSELVERYIVAKDELVLAGNPESDYWLLPETDSPLGFINENYLKYNNLSPNIIRTYNHDMALALLKHQVGKTIISKLALNSTVPYQRLEAIGERNLYFLTRKKVVSEKLAEISTFIQEQLSHNQIPF